MKITLIVQDRTAAWDTFRDLDARGIQVGFPSLGEDARLGGYTVQTAASAWFCARGLRARVRDALARHDRAEYVAAYEVAEDAGGAA